MLFSTMKRNAMRPLVAITGCDSGIGEALCRQYIDAGYGVIAGYLDDRRAPDIISLRPVALDLRVEDSIAAFASAVIAGIGEGFKLDSVILNAGVVAAGPVENIPVEAVREVFEVNFFGSYSLIQKLIPAIIHDKSRIGIVGSFAGRIALPLFSSYVSSKFALEGFTDSLRRELMPFGVRTVMFEPAAVATPIWSNGWDGVVNRFMGLVGERYKETFEKAGATFVAGGNAGLPAVDAARIIRRRLSSVCPRARYLVSRTPILNAIECALPAFILDRAIARLIGTAGFKTDLPD